MKQTIKSSIVGSLLAAALAVTGSAHAADLHVKVEKVKSTNGKLMLTLYNSADSYLKTPSHSASATPTAGDTVVTFKDVAPGEYALSGYHDENANGKIDTGSMGIPTESYGFGNNASGAMGPPSFDKARVSVPAGGASTSLTFN